MKKYLDLVDDNSFPTQKKTVAIQTLYFQSILQTASPTPFSGIPRTPMHHQLKQLPYDLPSMLRQLDRYEAHVTKLLPFPTAATPSPISLARLDRILYCYDLWVVLLGHAPTGESRSSCIERHYKLIEVRAPTPTRPTHSRRATAAQSIPSIPSDCTGTFPTPLPRSSVFSGITSAWRKRWKPRLLWVPTLPCMKKPTPRSRLCTTSTRYVCRASTCVRVCVLTCDAG